MHKEHTLDLLPHVLEEAVDAVVLLVVDVDLLPIVLNLNAVITLT